MKHEKKRLTKHAAYRIRHRHIPESLIGEVIARGRKTVIPDRKSVEYRLNNVLGVHGLTLVVVTDFRGTVITSYVNRSARPNL